MGGHAREGTQGGGRVSLIMHMPHVLARPEPCNPDIGWEVVLLLRRFFVIAAVVFGQAFGLGTQIILAMMVVVLNYGGNLYAQPYAIEALQAA